MAVCEEVCIRRNGTVIWQNDLLMVRIFSTPYAIWLSLTWVDSIRLNSIRFDSTRFQFNSFSMSANKFPAIATHTHSLVPSFSRYRSKIVRNVDAVYFNRQRYLTAGSQALIKIGLIMRRTHKTNSVIDDSADNECKCVARAREGYKMKLNIEKRSMNA